MKARFLAGCRTLFARDAGFSDRLDLLHPLYGLRWCLILLNEFLPERWARRAFAGRRRPHRRRSPATRQGHHPSEDADRP